MPPNSRTVSRPVKIRKGRDIDLEKATYDS